MAQGDGHCIRINICIALASQRHKPQGANARIDIFDSCHRNFYNDLKYKNTEKHRFKSASSSLFIRVRSRCLPQYTYDKPRLKRYSVGIAVSCPLRHPTHTMAKRPLRRLPPIHDKLDIAKSREAGQLAARVLEMLTPHVQAGVSTEHLDQLCHDFIVNELKCIPANIGYHGYPKTVCASVNHVVCHGIPSAQEMLKDGDIINVDVALIKDGWFGDTSRMYTVGKVAPKAQQLIDTTYEAMVAGIRAVKPGATLGDIGNAIQTVAQRDGFSVVRDYCGHGIGQIYHDEPQVLHYGYRGQGMALQEGMIFTIEPMLNMGKHDTKELDDGWTVITKDKSLSAQWEHMVVVTATGYEVLTTWPEGTGTYPAP